MRRKRRGFVYLAYIWDGRGLYKIGHAKDVGRRLNALRAPVYREIELIEKVEVLNAYRAEWLVHTYLARYRKQGELFALPSRRVWDEAIIHMYGKIRETTF